MAKELYLLGFPLTYSRSPGMQQAAFSYYGLEAKYALLPTPWACQGAAAFELGRVSALIEFMRGSVRSVLR
ncbi:MAG: hypothetical protein FD169_419 [Bacillota bacterium]|nr:MAG: hypothetical protein FD169_419 [Bacillota bacterium]